MTKSPFIISFSYSKISKEKLIIKGRFATIEISKTGRVFL